MFLENIDLCIFRPVWNEEETKSILWKPGIYLIDSATAKLFL